MSLLPPLPTLFPYTTLFRSAKPPKAKQASISKHSRAPKTNAVVRRSPKALNGANADAPEEMSPPTSGADVQTRANVRSEEHTSELQSHSDLVCRLLLEKKNN